MVRLLKNLYALYMFLKKANIRCKSGNLTVSFNGVYLSINEEEMLLIMNRDFRINTIDNHYLMQNCDLAFNPRESLCVSDDKCFIEESLETSIHVKEAEEVQL